MSLADQQQPTLQPASGQAQPLTLAMVAGEASGDLLASRVFQTTTPPQNQN